MMHSFLLWKRLLSPQRQRPAFRANIAFSPDESYLIFHYRSKFAVTNAKQLFLVSEQLHPFSISCQDKGGRCAKRRYTWSNEYERTQTRSIGIDIVSFGPKTSRILVRNFSLQLALSRRRAPTGRTARSLCAMHSELHRTTNNQMNQQ